MPQACGGTTAPVIEPLPVLYIGDLLPTQYAYYDVALLLALAFGKDQAPTPLPVLESKG